MFCNNCGNELKAGHQFCTECGHSNTSNATKKTVTNQVTIRDDRWWHRFLKVLYVFIYLQILWILPAVWSTNSSIYVGHIRNEYVYRDTYGQAFWYSLLALAIFVVVVRLIKITVLYVIWAQKPQWKVEFKKLF